MEINLNKINPNPFQYREVVSDEDIGELATSIKENGLLQPILVRKVADDGSYQLIAGARRLAAAKIAGLKTIFAIIREARDEEVLAFSIIENTHRQNPTPLEEARAFQALAERFSGNPNRVAEIIARKVGYVNDRLIILEMPEEIQNMAQDLGISKISELAKIQNHEQRVKMARLAIKNNYTVEDITFYSQEMDREPPKPRLDKHNPEDIVNMTNKGIISTFVKLNSLGKQMGNPDIRTAIKTHPHFRGNLQKLTEAIEIIARQLASSE